MYNGKKYNLVLACLVFIIAIVVGVSAGMAPSTALDNSGSGTDAVETLPQESGNDLPFGLTRPTADSNALTKLEFAINIMNRGAGYKSESYQNLTIKALSMTQQMKFTKYRGGGLDLSEEYFKIVGLLASQGKNELSSKFSDGKNMYEKIITNSNHFNYDAKSYTYSHTDKMEVQTVESYIQTRYPLNNFFVNIEKSSVSMINEKPSRTDTKNFVIAVTLNTLQLSPQFVEIFKANGGEGVKIDSVSLEFKISKETFFFTSYTQKVEFIASKPGLPASACVTELSERFVAMNVSQEATIKNIVSSSFDYKF